MPQGQKMSTCWENPIPDVGSLKVPSAQFEKGNPLELAIAYLKPAVFPIILNARAFHFSVLKPTKSRQSSLVIDSHLSPIISRNILDTPLLSLLTKAAR